MRQCERGGVRPPAVMIKDNPKLPQCHVDELLSEIDFVKEWSEIAGNDTTAPCP